MKQINTLGAKSIVDVNLTPSSEAESSLSFYLPKAREVQNQLRVFGDLGQLRGAGRRARERMSRLGLSSILDLLLHFPRTYLDLSTIKKISELQVDSKVTVIGEVRAIDKRRSFSGKDILQIVISDGSGYLIGVWFNQNYLADLLRVGDQVAFSGTVKFNYGSLQIVNPLYDVLDGPGTEETDVLNTCRIIPLYPLTAGLSPRTFRKLIFRAIREFSDFLDLLPLTFRMSQNLDLLSSEALEQIHFPSAKNLLLTSRRRLIFDELFLLEFALALKKRSAFQLPGVALSPDRKILKFIEGLPFRLTQAQRRVVGEIWKDLSRPHPMNRLIQGDVGSGKTIVAIIALMTAVFNGYQGAFMVPTEILAEQHYQCLRFLVRDWGVKVALLTSSLTPSQRKAFYEEIARGEIDIVVGTHALIQENVTFRNLALAIVDEQHRFGVRQRGKLKDKAIFPHLLVMSATPIPRSISQTIYGDLEVSLIDEFPQGKRDIKTILVEESHRGRAYQLIKQEVDKGEKAYVICPLIDESDKMELKSVLQEAEFLRSVVFKDYRVGLLHGQINAVEKAQIMEKFRGDGVDILISTTVIEVGVDVPEATVMLIENAERFGLAQLHQLRGRIGRKGDRSYCLLCADLREKEEAKKRIDAFIKISDGFKLAERDLFIRGEGQLFGERQSGFPDLKIASIVRHKKIIERVRQEAFAFLEDHRFRRSQKLLQACCHRLLPTRFFEDQG